MHEGLSLGDRWLPIPLVDRGADFVEGLAGLVETEGEATLALADVARAGHAIPLIAAQERVIPLDLGAAALTANAVDDLGDLAHFVERDASARGVGEILRAENMRRVDAGARRWVRARADVSLEMRKNGERG